MFVHDGERGVEAHLAKAEREIARAWLDVDRLRDTVEPFGRHVHLVGPGFTFAAVSGVVPTNCRSMNTWAPGTSASIRSVPSSVTVPPALAPARRVSGSGARLAGRGAAAAAFRTPAVGDAVGDGRGAGAAGRCLRLVARRVSSSRSRADQ